MTRPREAAFDPCTTPHPAVTVDVILFTIAPVAPPSRAGAASPRGLRQTGARGAPSARSRLEVLLIRRQLEPFAGRWALPGGFVRMDESLDDAARRELAEEAGVSVRWLEQLYTFGEVDRDPARRAITVTYFALIDAGALAPKAGGDATSVGWFPVDALPPLAFDHRRIVDYALERLRYKAEYAPVAFQFLPRDFTLSELQAAYEVIFGKRLDKRNFRRKVLGLGILEETGGERREGRGRPAALYRFSKTRFRDLGGGVVLAF